MNSVAFSPDGRTIASGGCDKTIKLWDTSSGRELRTLHIGPANVPDFVNSVAFSPDGRTIASGSDDRTIKLWDAASGRELRTLERAYRLLWILSPFRRTVGRSPRGATTIRSSSGTLRAVGNCGRCKVHTGRVNSVVFSPDGRTIASGSGDNTIKLWDAASGRELRTFKGHSKFCVLLSLFRRTVGRSLRGAKTRRSSSGA